jgi:hypothetical protein
MALSIACINFRFHESLVKRSHLFSLISATRHPLGTQKAERGIPMYEISKGLCHSDTKMTENYVKAVVKRSAGLYGWDQKIVLKNEI